MRGETRRLVRASAAFAARGSFPAPARPTSHCGARRVNAREVGRAARAAVASAPRPAGHRSTTRGVRAGSRDAAASTRPPTEVRVEFGKQGVDVFIQLADVVEEAFPSVAVTEREDAAPREGAFEVTHEDGTELFSKLKHGRPPRVEEVLEAIERKFKADGVDPFKGGGGGSC